MTCQCHDLAVWENPCSPDECGCHCHDWNTPHIKIATQNVRETT